MKSTLALAAVLVLILAAASAAPLMVYTGKLTPITPRLPERPIPVPYPPIPPAPVNEDPEPLNSLLYRRTVKYGFRIKPLKTYVPSGSFGKDVIFSYD